MMSTQECIVETEKRLAVLKQIYNHFDPLHFVGILLTGSMVYGKNTLVNQHSDIDLLFIMDHTHIQHIKNVDFFRGPYLNEYAFDLFHSQGVDALYNDYYIDGIKINIGIWNSTYLTEFCNLRQITMRIYKEAIRRTILQVFSKRKKLLSLSPIIKNTEEGWILEYNIQEQGDIVGLPLLNNLVFSEILKDNDGIRELVTSLKRNLKKWYTDAELAHLFSYVLDKIPEDRSSTIAKLLDDM